MLHFVKSDALWSLLLAERLTTTSRCVCVSSYLFLPSSRHYFHFTSTQKKGEKKSRRKKERESKRKHSFCGRLSARRLTWWAPHTPVITQEDDKRRKRGPAVQWNTGLYEPKRAKMYIHRQDYFGWWPIIVHVGDTAGSPVVCVQPFLSFTHFFLFGGRMRERENKLTNIHRVVCSVGTPPLSSTSNVWMVSFLSPFFFLETRRVPPGEWFIIEVGQVERERGGGWCPFQFFLPLLAAAKVMLTNQVTNRPHLLCACLLVPVEDPRPTGPRPPEGSPFQLKILENTKNEMKKKKIRNKIKTAQSAFVVIGERETDI